MDSVQENPAHAIRRRIRFSLRAVLICIAVVALIFALIVPLFRPPPMATGIGISLQFDAHLDEIDKRYRFVFAEGDRVVLTRIDGSIERVLFDLSKQKNLANAEVVDVQLSPDHLRLLVACLDGPWDQYGSRKLLIVELASGKTQTVDVPNTKFGFDMGMAADSICNWAGNESFVISLTEYPAEGAHLYRKKFLHFDMSSLSSPRELDLGVRRPCFESPDGYKFLFVGGYERPSERTVRALVGGQVRKATSEEVSIFEELESGCSGSGPAVVLVDRVSKGEEPLFGSDPNWNKYDVYLDQRWVRRSNSLIERDPVWDEDLDLYIWYEYQDDFQTFFTDTKGRYRNWYRGKYIGKVLREQLDIYPQ